MAKSSSVVGIGVVLLVLFLAVFLVYKPKSPGVTSGATGAGGTTTPSGATGAGGTTTPSGGGGGTTTPSGGEGGTSPISGLSVTVIDNDSIVINKTGTSFTTGTDYGYFLFTLYDVEDLNIPYARARRTQSYDVYNFIQEISYYDTYGYPWNGITPNLQPNTKYWIKVEKSNADMTKYSRVGVLTFTTGTFTPPESTPSDLQETERNFANFSNDLKEQVIGIIPDLMMIAAEYITASDSRKLFYNTLKNGMRIASNSTSKLTRISHLSKVSVRFKMFLDGITLDAIQFIGAYLPRTLVRYAGKFSNNFDEIWAQSARRLNNTSIENARRIATKVGEKLLSVASKIVTTALSAADLALLVLSFAIGPTLDEENIGNMQDWNKFKTSDFLLIKEILTNMQKKYYQENGYTLIPAINGPFLKYNNYEFEEKIRFIEIDLLLLPMYIRDKGILKNIQNPNDKVTAFLNLMSSFSSTNLKYYLALSQNGTIESENDINFIENQEVMIELRKLQNILINAFNTRNSNRPATLPENWYFDTYKYTYVQWIIENTANSNKIHQIATYILCKVEGGKPIGTVSNHQCSFRTSTECFNSYPWPLINNYTPSQDNIVSESPCSPGVSPCLDRTNDFGKTDFFYSEWRDPNLLYKDYGGLDYRTDPNASDGVCAIVPVGTRLLCEGTTKLDGSNNIIGKNNYNVYTGECTNTKQYCDAFGVSYTNSMNPSEMANRGSGPLPSCFQKEADKVGAIMLGGSGIIQYINIGTRIIGKFFESLFGLDDKNQAAIRAYNDNVKIQTGIASSMSDEVQIVNFQKYMNIDYMFSENISLIDFKVDKDGNIYCLYAYGIYDGCIILVKYDKFFTLISDNNWSSGSYGNTFPFKGPVENFISSCLFLDSQGNVYILMFDVNSYGELEQKIIKRNGLNGDQITQFVPINPKQMTSQQNQNLDMPLKDKNIPDPRFNGIYIRNNKLYVAYSGAEKDGNNNTIQNYFKFFTFNLNTGVYTGDIFPSVPNLITYFNTLPTNDELFSFCVDDNESIFSSFLNTGPNGVGTGKILQFNSKNSILARIIPLSDYNKNYQNSVFADNRLVAYPSICIDKSNRLIVSTGFKKWVLDGNTFINTSDKFFIERYSFFPNINSFLSDGYNPWEVCFMDIDSNNNICEIIKRDNYINFGELNSQKNKIIYNKLKPQVPEKREKKMTISSAELYIDYILFKDINFINCLGHENVSLEITPDPLENNFDQTKGKNFGQTTVGEIMRYKRGTSIELPLLPGKLIFALNQTYSITVKINGKSVLPLPLDLRIDTSKISFDIQNLNNCPFKTRYNPPNETVDIDISRGLTSTSRIYFNKPIRVTGSRILYIDIVARCWSFNCPGIDTNLFTVKNIIIHEQYKDYIDLNKRVVIGPSIVYFITIRIPQTSIQFTTAYSADGDVRNIPAAPGCPGLDSNGFITSPLPFPTS